MLVPKAIPSPTGLAQATTSTCRTRRRDRNGYIVTDLLWDGKYRGRQDEGVAPVRIELPFQ